MLSLLDQFARCQSAPEFYRVQIIMGTQLSTLEVAGLLAHAGEMPPQAAEPLRKLWGMMFRDKTVLEPFWTRRIDDNVAIYGDDRTPRSKKHLLLGFAGHTARLMMPTAIVQQYISAARFDLALVNDPARAFYLRGIRGYAEDFPALVARLARDLEFDAYASVRCLGTSGGGAAALYATALLGAPLGVSVGGSHPAFSLKQRPAAGFVGDEIDIALKGLGAPAGSTLINVFGELNAADRDGSLSLVERFPGMQSRAVRKVADHNVLFDLYQSGRMGPFFDRTVCA
jgi:hypothetical protein